MNDTLFNFGKFIKNLSDVGDRIHRIKGDCIPQTKSEYEDKKRVLSILNAVKKSVVDFYLNRETISKLI